ncbi:MAG: hypothetical protein AAFO94_12850 [Bacteroidota bacterium]
MTKANKPTPPIAKKIAKPLTIHGDTRIDPYYWLNQREDPEVVNYLKAENDYLEAELAHTKSFREQLFEEIKGRIKKTDMSVPYKDNGYYYLTRYEEGSEYPIFARKKASMEADEEIMIDANVLAKPHKYYKAAGLQVSPDNRLLAYAEDTVSRRIYTLRFKNLETGEMLDDVIPNTTGSVVWANDNQTVFYTVKDEALRPYKVFRHRLGTDPSEDELIFHESDDTFLVYLYKTKSDRFLVIGSYHTDTNEYQVLNADEPFGKWHTFHPRDVAGKLEYSIAHYEDQWYVLTNWDAKNFRLMQTPVTATGRDNWQEVIAHRESVLIADMDIFKDYLVLSERIDGIRKLRVLPWQGADHYIDFGEDSYVAYTSINPEFDTELLRISYTSMTTPSTTYDYNMRTRDKKLLKQQEVLGDFDASHYQSERIYATARDGVRVPISLVYKKGTPKDGSAPLLLYAYGSYGSSMDPYFSSELK